jgi:hypothetical protein
MINSMADSVALRSRRYRAHSQGDHHLCRHQASILIDASSRPVMVGADFDPGDAMAQLAGRLKAAYAADPGNAALARELRMTLQAMTVSVGADPFGEWLSAPG